MLLSSKPATRADSDSDVTIYLSPGFGFFKPARKKTDGYLVEYTISHRSYIERKLR